MGIVPQQAMEDGELACAACRPVKRGDSVVIEREGTVVSGAAPTRGTKSQMLCNHPY